MYDKIDVLSVKADGVLCGGGILTRKRVPIMSDAA
jgi:hypothetical protein